MEIKNHTKRFKAVTVWTDDGQTVIYSLTDINRTNAVTLPTWEKLLKLEDCKNFLFLEDDGVQAEYDAIEIEEKEMASFLKENDNQ